MASQRPIETLAGAMRLAPYLKEAGGDDAKAADLYLWAADLAGALHFMIAFAEVAVRNALDVQLAEWNRTQVGQRGRDGALRDCTAPLLYELTSPKRLKFARESAEKEARRRPKGHPRRGVPVTNDDVVAQLMLGAWGNLVVPVSGSSRRQQRLWVEGLNAAFPGIDSSDAGRAKAGRQLERIRKLRNRVAHHDSLLGVEIDYRLNDVLTVLRVIDPRLPALALARSRVRAVEKDDPRRRWNAR
ncbi:MAG: hypothetical protein LKF88_01695 [Microbacteriaceae bacterium]|nr:hypothetical protein [Microbacteriaceae bacterium]